MFLIVFPGFSFILIEFIRKRNYEMNLEDKRVDFRKANKSHQQSFSKSRKTLIFNYRLV